MSDESVGQTPTVFSSKERAALVAKALSEAARRARFSTKRRRSAAAGGLRARRGAELFRLIQILSFVLLVAIPVVVLGAYVFFIASSQYVAESRFTVRSGMPSSSSKSAVNGAAALMIAQNTQIILNYAESRAMVEQLQKRVDFKGLFTRHDIDYFSRMSSRTSIEKQLRYWRKHITTTVTLQGGIVTMEIAAFSPEDSVRISEAVLDASEELVNEINDKMKADSVAVAEAERKHAEEHLAKTRANLENVRNTEGMLSPEATSAGFDTLLDTEKAQLANLQATFDAQRRFVRADAPQMKTLASRIAAAKQQIVSLEAQITRHDGDAKPLSFRKSGEKDVLSGSMTRLDYAKLENDIAEKIYAASLAALEEAKVASEVKLMYVSRFVEPSLPERSRYPDRGLAFTLLVAASLTAWGIVLLVSRFALNKIL